jgi:hypothetical protein
MLCGGVIDKAGRCECGNEGISCVRWKSRVEGHRRISALPHLHEGVDKALTGLRDRY